MEPTQHKITKDNKATCGAKTEDLKYYWYQTTCQTCLKLRVVRVKKTNREWKGLKLK